MESVRHSPTREPAGSVPSRGMAFPDTGQLYVIKLPYSLFLASMRLSPLKLCGKELIYLRACWHIFYLWCFTLLGEVHGPEQIPGGSVPNDERHIPPPTRNAPLTSDISIH